METRGHPPRLEHARRVGFTLVELLVVITIIGILASLIAVAAVGALNRAREAEIKIETDQLGGAFETYRDSQGSYPPNCQIDGPGPLNENQVLVDLKRHLKQAFPRHREPDTLLQLMLGQTIAGSKELPGGMTAGEALVFWLGGFGTDPKYPISGEGGPSYLASNGNIDPIESRNWVYQPEVARLGPRNNTNYFDASNGRFIEYMVSVNGAIQRRRINFWQYVPRKSIQPYLYFDTSRHPAVNFVGSTPLATFDPPAATELTGLGTNGLGLHVHAVKTLDSSGAVRFANDDKFQILHAGVDDEWGEDGFDRMTVENVSDVNEMLLYPTGPFTGEVADTIMNFSTATLEKSQP